MFNLLALLDDIAATFDDVAIMTKVAMKKTSALMSDDLAVNAGVVHGVSPNRELPMVKAIFLGSLLNKVYCILGVLILMATWPPLLKIILFIGGLYLSFEGVHKIIEKLFHHSHANEKKDALTEKQKVKGAVRTDLILSIEIIVIAETATKGDLLMKSLSLAVIGLLASIIIYGLVALLVKIDDLGLHLIDKGHEKAGSLLVSFMPYMMKGLGIIGTGAMLLVGGGIITHTFHIPTWIPEILQNLLAGTLAGMVVVGLFELIKKVRQPKAS
jgi:uncharacterized protein